MRIPVATYRLQINDDFTLHDARAIVPYLAHLGISDLYLSPVFEARSGSTHGYDVTDPTRIRASIGGMDALTALAREVGLHHMGILLDIVPNHMAASVENPWWRDVLQHGRASAHAHFFDIDWGTPEEPRRLALPILGDTLDEVISRGEITVDADAGLVHYFDTTLPLAPGTAADDIRATLQAQHYELVHWRTAAEMMTYRRFFDITDLAGVRVEDDETFRTTHSLLRELAGAGIITGLRIDHIDGLADPAAYLKALREYVRGPDGGPLFTVVEKIVESAETLPADWECEGTTGYEFLSLATALLIEPGGMARIDTFYRRISGDTRQFRELGREKKLLVMERLFGGELASLARGLDRLAGTGFAAARRAIAEVTASMDVYRTYTRDCNVSATDRRRIAEAVTDALQRTHDAGLGRAIECLRRVALLEHEDAGAALAWVTRWQQFTGPVMAKGYEDTALYCHNALLAANDVGSDPARPCLTPGELAAALNRRSKTGALSLNATATHDTKRGEDTRARIAVLSELPEEWRSRLRRWIREGDAWKGEMTEEEEETVAPSADVQSLLYQTLLGAWPLDGVDASFRERIKAYMTKAVREAKEQTSWRRPDEDYENALGAFIERLMAELGRAGLAEDVGAFARRLASHGALNSIAQMLLKVTAPGIPDLYQGTELWSHTLVDPDNRAAVDFTLRQRLFSEIAALRDTPDGGAARSLFGSWEDGRIKLLFTALALRFRATHRDVFEESELVALEPAGSRADHVFAFARVRADRACITVLPRWTAALGDGTVIAAEVWGDTTVPLTPQLRCSWHNALTGETMDPDGALHVATLFRSVPFALLDVSQPVGA